MSLYLDIHCEVEVALAGACFPGFSLTQGIRQGCPLSPLLYAFSDLFLRRMARLSPAAVRRAFADDLAMVLAASAQRLRSLERFFAEFALISGLQLHVAKTVRVPTDALGLSRVRALLADRARSWAGMAIAKAAMYLGVFFGLGRGQLS